MSERVHPYRSRPIYVDTFDELAGTYLVKPNLFTTVISEKGATADLEIIFSIEEVFKKSSSRPIVSECLDMTSYTRPDTVLDSIGTRSLS